MILAAALLVGLTSCEKDDKLSNGKPLSKAEQLTQNPWNLEKTHTTTKANGQVIFNESFPMTGTVTFKNDNTGVSVTPEDGTENFTWMLKGDSLIIDGESAYLQKLTSKKMELQQSFTETDSAFGEIKVDIVMSLNR